MVRSYPNMGMIEEKKLEVLFCFFLTLKTLIFVLQEVVEITYENKVIFGFVL